MAFGKHEFIRMGLNDAAPEVPKPADKPNTEQPIKLETIANEGLMDKVIERTNERDGAPRETREISPQEAGRQRLERGAQAVSSVWKKTKSMFSGLSKRMNLKSAAEHAMGAPEYIGKAGEAALEGINKGVGMAAETAHAGYQMAKEAKNAVSEKMVSLSPDRGSGIQRLFVESPGQLPELDQDQAAQAETFWKNFAESKGIQPQATHESLTRILMWDRSNVEDKYRGGQAYVENRLVQAFSKFSGKMRKFADGVKQSQQQKRDARYARIEASINQGIQNRDTSRQEQFNQEREQFANEIAEMESTGDKVSYAVTPEQFRDLYAKSEKFGIKFNVRFDIYSPSKDAQEAGETKRAA